MLNRKVNSTLAMAMVFVVCLTSTGCVGGLAQLFYVLRGHEIPAQYDELKSKRVVVIVNTEASAYGPDSLAETLEKFVSMKLSSNVSNIEIVSKLEVDNWIDINGFDPAKFAELGKAVDADYVLSVGIADYSIREGSTLYKGKADLSVSVIESKSGKSTYVVGPDRMEYPENGRPAIQTNDRKFEVFYLAWLSEQIAKQFYRHDKTQDVARDAALIHN